MKKDYHLEQIKVKFTKKSFRRNFNIKGGTNINTEVKDGNIIVNLNEEIKLTNTTLNKDGLNIKDDKGNLYINLINKRLSRFKWKTQVDLVIIRIM